LIHRLKNVWLLLPALLFVSCEDVVIDYASDIVGIYFVETSVINGTATNYSQLPSEEAWIIDISKESLLSYENDVNQCDTTYSMGIKAISKVTDTTIVFEDETSYEYSIGDDQLLLYDGDDILTLESYTSEFPPVSWVDPTQLENDDYEPDSSVALATRISAASAVQTHYSAVCDDVDFYIFEALSGTSYIIEVNTGSTSNVDLTISLYNLAGDSIAYNDDKSSTKIDPYLEWTCEVTGDYYFVVKKYWDYLDPGNSLDDEHGEYSISIDVTKGLTKEAPSIVLVKHPRQAMTHTQNEFFK